MITRTCPICKKVFTPQKANVRNQICCSHGCSKERDSIRYKAKNPTSHISNGSVGAMNELLVCADLLKRGFEVFRAVSPSSSIDLMIFHQNKTFRVEVTTGKISPTDKLMHPKKQTDRFDVLAVVVYGKIIYTGLPEINQRLMIEAAVRDLQ